MIALDVGVVVDRRDTYNGVSSMFSCKKMQ